MCGRFAFFSPREAVLRTFGVDCLLPLPPRYNIAPSQSVLALRESRGGPMEAVMLRWGLVPFWAKDPSIGQRMINARAETVAEKPAYRRAFRRQRCVILADGFYEWVRSKNGKIPFYIDARNANILAMAGLWDTWESGSDRLETCTIITTTANRLLASLHQRMPVLLTPETTREWIDSAQRSAATLRGLLKPCDEEVLQYKKVSRLVNISSNEGPRLLESG
jgi:putative SOS response-associated peptidase YedK